MKKVLLITDVNFWEGSSGNRVRISALVGYLAHFVELTVINTGPAPAGIETQLNFRYGAKFHVLCHNDYLTSGGYTKRLKKFLTDSSFDTVIIEYIHNSYFLNALPQETRVILDIHDITSDRTEEFRKFNYAGQLYELTESVEFQILSCYDYIMVLCEPDRNRLMPILGAECLLFCPHPVALSSRVLRPDVRNISFIASEYLPNVDAIESFIAECWHLISDQTDITLNIYGTVCNKLKRTKMRSLNYKGFTPNINEIYDNSDIIINPVRFGAGMKIKNIEALANALPLVTTSHGARGLEDGVGEAFLVADSPDEFTGSIKNLCEDFSLRKRLSHKGQDIVRNKFAQEQCFQPLLNAIGV